MKLFGYSLLFLLLFPLSQYAILENDLPQLVVILDSMNPLLLPHESPKEISQKEATDLFEEMLVLGSDLTKLEKNKDISKEFDEKYVNFFKLHSNYLQKTQNLPKDTLLTITKGGEKKTFSLDTFNKYLEKQNAQLQLTLYQDVAQTLVNQFLETKDLNQIGDLSETLAFIFNISFSDVNKEQVIKLFKNVVDEYIKTKNIIIKNISAADARKKEKIQVLDAWLQDLEKLRDTYIKMAAQPSFYFKIRPLGPKGRKLPSKKPIVVEPPSTIAEQVGGDIGFWAG